MSSFSTAFRRNDWSAPSAKDRDEKRRRRETRLCLAALCAAVGIIAAALLVLRPGAEGRAGPSSNAGQGDRGLREFSFEQVARLHAEAMASPATGPYQRLLASELSRVGREAIGALIDENENVADAEEFAPLSDAAAAGRGSAGELLAEVERVHASTVLLAVWERLSALAAEATRAVGRDAPRDAGHMTLAEAEELRRLLSRPGVDSACEVGFNAGHSAVAALLARPALALLAVDVAQHPYVARAAALVARLFPGRFELRTGDSPAVLAALAAEGRRCALVRIDGGHLDGRPAADLAAAAQLAAGPRLVWMDDVGCSNWNCVEPTAAWAAARAAGRVAEEACAVQGASHGYCLGTFA